MEANIMIDKKLKNKIESAFIYENDIYSLKFTDLEDTFWFNNSIQLQDFLNAQIRERYYDKELRKGYFDYINENNDIVRYYIKTYRGHVQQLESIILN